MTSVQGDSVLQDTTAMKKEEDLPEGSMSDVEMHDALEEQTEVIPQTDEEILRDTRMKLLEQVNSENKPFEWRHITDDLLKDETTEQLDDLKMRITMQVETADEIFYEVIYCAKYHPERASMSFLTGLLNSIVEANNSEEVLFKFIAILNTFETDQATKDLVKGFQKLPSRILGLYLEDEKELLEYIPNYHKSRSAYIQKLGEQQSWSLLSESNEGYAKLMTFFNMAVDSRDSYFQVDYVNRGVERLIGHFSLYPPRVLDLLLDISSHSVFANYRFILDFFKRSQWWPKGNEADNSSLKSLDKGGNQLVARLIGAKLKVALRKNNKYFSENLKLLITIFIKEGFISFGSVLQYTFPDDAGMEELKELIDDQIQDEIFKASANALALSGPLVDDEDDSGRPSTSASETKKEEPKPKIDVNLNQKVILLRSLLINGLFWPSVYLLNRYPYLVHADADIPTLMIRLFEVVITPLKRQHLQVLDEESQKELLKRKRVAFQKKASASNTVEYTEFLMTEAEVFSPFNRDHASKNFVYFYHEWSNDIPQATTFEQLFEYSNVFLSFLGAKLGLSAQLLSSLIKLGVSDLKSKTEGSAEYSALLDRWFNYFKKFLFPASTYAHENPITSHDLYELLQKFPLDWRYNLYGDLFQNISKNNLFVRLNYSKAEKGTKDLLKRITTENVKPMMRRLAKITFSNPLPAFLVIINQIESYDNLTNLIVEAARYFTDYAWDVLPFVLLMRLTARRDAVKSDGLNDSLWLQSLSTFIAKLAKGYAAFNFEPILTYILKDLHKQNTIGLTVLREIVNQMGGIQQSSNLSSNQIKLLNSSDTLQKIARKVLMDTREESRRSAERLLGLLKSTGQLSEVFVLLYDFNRRLNNNIEDANHYKVLSSQIDESSAVLHTYIELVTYFSKSDAESFYKNVIGLSDLVSTYKVSTPWAFELWRNYIRDIDTDQKFVDVSFDALTPLLYTTFWKLNLYDINYDEELYQSEKEKLETSNISISRELAALRRERDQREAEKQKKVLLATEKWNKEILETLEDDQLKHQQHSAKILESLTEESKSWFTLAGPSSTEFLEAFIQFCVVPRATQSASDAVFTGRFITSVLGPDISTELVETLLGSEIIETLIYTFTPLEAENFSLFMAEIVRHYEKIRVSEEISNDMKKTIYKWHSKILEFIKADIQSENYMSRRNAINFLKSLITIYPVVEGHGESIVETIQKVSATESRHDLKLASDAILAHISARSSKWIHIWEFVDYEEDEKLKLVQEREALLRLREAKKEEAKRLAEAKIEEQRREQEAAHLAARLARERTQPPVEATVVAEKKEEAEVSPTHTNEEEDEDEEMIEEEVEKKLSNIAEPVEKKVTDAAPEKEKEANTEPEPEQTRVEATVAVTSNPSKPFEKSAPEPRQFNLRTRAAEPEKKVPPKFKDVMSTGSPPPSHSPYAAQLKSILIRVEENSFAGLKSLVSNGLVRDKLDAAMKGPADRFTKTIKNILENYALELTGNDSTYRGFSSKLNDVVGNLKQVKKATETPQAPKSIPSGPKTAFRKAPLPPQSAISGLSAKPTPKWGMDNRTYQSQPEPQRYNQGYRSTNSHGDSSRSGYRDQSSAGRNDKGDGNYKRSSHYPDKFNDKRQRR